MKTESRILDLNTGQACSIYLLEPKEAIISEVILRLKTTSNLIDKEYRQKVFESEIKAIKSKKDNSITFYSEKFHIAIRQKP